MVTSELATNETPAVIVPNAILEAVTSTLVGVKKIFEFAFTLALATVTLLLPVVQMVNI